MNTKKQVEAAFDALNAAQIAFDEAKEAHRLAFREACVQLFNEYGLAIIAYGDEGASLDLEELRAPVALADIPE